LEIGGGGGNGSDSNPTLKILDLSVAVAAARQREHRHILRQNFVGRGYWAYLCFRCFFLNYASEQ
jgi:hypothetical protein